MITVLQPGLLTTVQDEGRPGHRASGMPVAGALDAQAYALANVLAGNPPGAAALELTLLGATLRFEAPARVALAGADMQATLEGHPLPPWSAASVTRGGVLALGAARDGVRTYLAVRGGIDVPPVLGSRATYTRAAVGGFHGRALAKGDLLPLAPGAGAAGDPPLPLRLPDLLTPRHERDLALRVVLGPQDDRFRREGVATFLEAAYTVTNRNDRMGYLLEGPAIAHAAGPDILSEPHLPGAVQVPGSGMPLVLMADCQTVGGYAKIATVIGADLPRLAQARRGDQIRFRAVAPREAVAALRRERRRLEAAADWLARGGAP